MPILPQFLVEYHISLSFINKLMLAYKWKQITAPEKNDIHMNIFSNL